MLDNVFGSVVDLTAAVGKAGFDVTKGVTAAVANPLVELGTSAAGAVGVNVPSATAATGSISAPRTTLSPAKLLAAGKDAFMSGEYHKSLRLYERCVGLGGDSKLLEAKALEAKAAVEKAVLAMEEAASLAVQLHEATEALAAGGTCVGDAHAPAAGELVAPESVLPLPDEQYAKMDVEDKVDELRTVLPSRSSQELRKLVGAHGGDIKKAFAAAQGSGHLAQRKGDA